MVGLCVAVAEGADATGAGRLGKRMREAMAVACKRGRRERIEVVRKVVACKREAPRV